MTIFSGIVSSNSMDGHKLIGGFIRRTDLENDETLQKVAKLALKQMELKGKHAGCKLDLVTIEEAWSQVVAGTNWKVTMIVKKSCGGKDTKIKSQVKIFQPLPYQCKAEEEVCVNVFEETEEES